jgi:hypothetical protein
MSASSRVFVFVMRACSRSRVSAALPCGKSRYGRNITDGRVNAANMRGMRLISGETEIAEPRSARPRSNRRRRWACPDAWSASFRPTGAFHTRGSEQRAGHRAPDVCSRRTNWPSSTSRAAYPLAGHAQRDHPSAMFVVSEEEAAAIRAAFDQGGEFAAAVELRRRFPGITDTATARECARTIAGWKPLSLPPRPPARLRRRSREE